MLPQNQRIQVHINVVGNSRNFSLEKSELLWRAPFWQLVQKRERAANYVFERVNN